MEALGHGRVSVAGAYYGSFRLNPSGPGERLAGFVIDAELGIIGNLFVNPMPLPDEQGRYRPMTKRECDGTAVCLILEGGGRDGERISPLNNVLALVESLPEVRERMLAKLGSIGYRTNTEGEPKATAARSDRPAPQGTTA